MPLQQRKIEESSRHQSMAESIAKLEKSFEVSLCSSCKHRNSTRTAIDAACNVDQACWQVRIVAVLGAHMQFHSCSATQAELFV
jgi:hypothetical protein